MSTSYGGTPPGITGTHYGGWRLGTPGAQVPSTGEDGPGYLYAGLSLPADNAVEVRGPITQWPALGGTLAVYEDSAFDYTGPSDYALYALYVDGVASTTDIGYGAGVGRFDLNVGNGLSGNVTLEAVVAAGAMTGGGAAGSLSGGVTLDDVVAAGVLAGGGQSELGGSVALSDVLASGVLQGEALGFATTISRIGSPVINTPRS